MGSQCTPADKIQELGLKDQICLISVTSYISPNISICISWSNKANKLHCIGRELPFSYFFLRYEAISTAAGL